MASDLGVLINKTPTLGKVDVDFSEVGLEFLNICDKHQEIGNNFGQKGKHTGHVLQVSSGNSHVRTPPSETMMRGARSPVSRLEPAGGKELMSIPVTARSGTPFRAQVMSSPVQSGYWYHL